jgi:hypothetical protein
MAALRSSPLRRAQGGEAPKRFLIFHRESEPVAVSQVRVKSDHVDDTQAARRCHPPMFQGQAA